MQKITEVTRRDIIDILTYKFWENDKIYYCGRLDELVFLERLYKLKEMPSTDIRFEDAEKDIWQHTINNDDWERDWVFSDSRFELLTSDEKLLNFICQVFHPVIRIEDKPWEKYLEEINELLKEDGYELYKESKISGRVIYGWKEKESIVKKGGSVSLKLNEIGRGSYAIVYSYLDNFYNKKFALKRLKKGVSAKDSERFRREFNILKELNSPYLVEVYNYFEDKKEYTMEYMDITLYDFIQKYNNSREKLKVDERFKIINQILRCFQYLHSKEIFHRDISYKNILLKEFEDLRVVKVSDFGLVKLKESTLTSCSTEVRGSLNDPVLERLGFEKYSFIHETYALTQVITFVLTGKTNLSKIKNREIINFFNKGMNSDIKERFQNINELKNAIKILRIKIS